MSSSQQQHPLLTLIVFVFLGAVLYVLYKIFTSTIALIPQTNPDIAIAIVAASFTAIVSVATVRLTKSYETRMNFINERRKRIIPTYERFIEMIMELQMKSKTGEKIPDDELMDFFRQFTKELMFWGSDDVISAWVRWRINSRSENKSNTDKHQLLFLTENIIMKMRKDLGHKNKGLKKGTILGMTVNDIDDILQGKQPN